MDESLKRRLIGAGLLLLAAFLLASMLPEPRLREAPAPGEDVVAIELREADVVAAQGSPAMAVTPMPRPTVVPEPDVAYAPDAGDSGTPPDIESGDRSVLTPSPSPAAPRPTPLPASQAALPTPATAAVATPSAAPVQAAAAVPAPSPAPSAGVGGTRWWVQIGSYSDIANARVVETRMRELGQAVVIAPIDTRTGVLYRVRCGPYASEAGGRDVHARVVAAGYPEARLINP